MPAATGRNYQSAQDFAMEGTGMQPDLHDLERVLAAAISEDIGSGDVTSELLVPPDLTSTLHCVARERLVACGIRVAMRVITEIDGSSTLQGASIGRITQLPMVEDGEEVTAGGVLLKLEGNARLLLKAERTMLNLMQRMSGVATLTRHYVKAIEGTGAIIRDTRKTMPGLRELDKYATYIGGALNHRMRMDDGILIKDNHIAMVGSVTLAIQKAREGIPKGVLPLEVECDTIEQAKEALQAGPDEILLDNMSPPQLREVVALRNSMANCTVKLEASGGITMNSVRDVAETGVDYIAIGDITHSARAMDIGLDAVE